jgi:hypothetical protein
MKRRIMAMTGLTVLAAVSLAIAGCNNAAESGGGGTGATAAAADDKAAAKQELIAAAAKLGTTTFKINLSTGGFEGNGVADPAGKKSQLSLGGGTSSTGIELRMIRNDIWMKIPGMPVGDGKWMHLDTAELGADSRLHALGSAGDPGGTQAMVKAIAEVEKVGEGKYKGTLDLSRSANSKFLTETLKDKGISADQLVAPFEATVDRQGRLTSLTVDQTELLKTVAGGAGAGIAAAAGKVEMKLSGFGVAVSVKAPPASQVTEIPDEVLKVLGG